MATPIMNQPCSNSEANASSKMLALDFWSSLSWFKPLLNSMVQLL